MKPAESRRSTGTLPSSDSDTEEFQSMNEAGIGVCLFVRGGNESVEVAEPGVRGESMRCHDSSRARIVRGGCMRGHAQFQNKTTARSVRGGRQAKNKSQNQLLLEGPWKK